MKKYETYKDSGLEWLGMVPEHWEILPFKRGVSINNGRDYKHVQSEDGYPVIGSGGQFAFASDYLYDGEVILLGRKGTIDKPRYFNGKFWTVDTMFYAIPTQKCIAKYMYYQALTIPFSLYSTDTALPSMTQTDLGNHLMCFPPTSEQRAIASYLDHKVGQIDALISEKEKMVEDLKAYRSSLITETVTKGLNKEVKMKDSGVEWIKKIPATWTTVLLKRCATIMTGGTPSTDIDRYWANPTFRWYTPSDFSDDDVVLNDSSRKLDETAIKEYAAKLFPKNSVFVVGIGATLGKVGISLNECSSNQQINAIIFNSTVLPEYGAYYLLAGKEYIKSQSNAATLPILNQSTMGELQIVVPNIEEQKNIVGFINKKVSVIKEDIENLQIQLSDLKSYKSSLITEAVTGKIDLRDWQTKKS